MKYQTMYYWVFLILLLWSCKSTENSNNDLKTLLKQQKELRETLKNLNAQIAVLDSSKKNTLPLVRVQQIEPKNFAHFVEIQGTVRSDYALDLHPELGGKVEKIQVREGDYVNSGAVLVKINTEAVDKQIKELKVNLELANLNYEKQAKLYAQGVGTELEYKRIKNDKETLEQKLAALQVQYQKLMIKAPFTGYIDKVYTRVGEMSSPQTALIRVVDLQKIMIEAEVSEMYLHKIKEGSLANIYFPALGLELSNLKVMYSSKYIHTQNRTFTVQIHLDNKDKKILPNLIAKVKLEDFREKNALVVPAQTVLYNNKNEAYLFVLHDEKKVEKRKVEVGLSYQGEQHILSGLEAGDWVITEGYQALTEGDLVQIFK